MLAVQSRDPILPQSWIGAIQGCSTALWSEIGSEKDQRWGAVWSGGGIALLDGVFGGNEHLFVLGILSNSNPRRSFSSLPYPSWGQEIRPLES
jgi:hypothetical protein